MSKRRKRKRSSNTGLARRVKKLEKKQEVKVHDIGVGQIMNIPVAGVITALGSIAQGDTIAQRDGNKIAPFFFNLRFQWNGDTLAVGEVYRTIVLIDTQQTPSVAPTVLEILQTASPLSQYNHLRRHRFKVLYDQMFSQASDAAISMSQVMVVNRKLRKIMSFSGAGSTTWNQNGLFMVNIANQATNLPNFNFSFRLWFND